MNNPDTVGMTPVQETALQRKMRHLKSDAADELLASGKEVGIAILECDDLGDANLIDDLIAKVLTCSRDDLIDAREDLRAQIEKVMSARITQRAEKMYQQERMAA